MKAPELSILLNLYAEIAPSALFRLLQRNLGLRRRSGIYAARVVIWMMMMQRLHARGTLADAVQQLALGECDHLLSKCKRVREHKIAVSTGGYCQARRNLSKVLVERSVDEILQRLRNHLSEPVPSLQAPAYALDGSSLQLQHCTELKQAYPPAPNQHGESHWPILRIVVLQELETGLAERPCWGPMYGPAAVSEQLLAEQAMDRLPSGAILLGDRNFGVFAIAYAAHLRGHGVVIRLTEARAKHLRGGAISAEGAWEREWKASAADRVRHPEWLADAAVPGRLIACRVGRGKSKQWLYVFATPGIGVEQAVALYGKRWRVEDDLRSLKQTVRLQRIAVQSVDMLEKELLTAVLAFNLVRAIMILAARRAGLPTRQLSFTYAYNLVQHGIGGVFATGDTVEQLERMERLIDLVARCKLPRRRKHRSFVRGVWARPTRYPHKKTK
jgi:hypothetical protein